MSDEHVWHELVAVMRETFERDDLEVTRETSARDVDNWDSLTHVELIVALESTFGVKLRTGEIARLKTVGELSDVIADRIRDSGR